MINEYGKKFFNIDRSFFMNMQVEKLFEKEANVEILALLMKALESKEEKRFIMFRLCLNQVKH